MAKQITQLTIFFSGTSEVEAECAALNKVIQELNRLLEKTKDLSIKIISWPQDIRPGINADSQKEINRQLQDRYDIYIGMLGSRFGTNTPRAGSGTEEEFEIALSKYLNDTTSVRVLFYFKKTDIDPFLINPEQLEKVQNFRNKLSQRGVIYKDFKDTSNFVDFVKDDIWNLIIDEWQNNRWEKMELTSLNESSLIQNGKIEIQLKQEENLITENDEVGYLELIEDFYVHNDTIIMALNEITDYTSQIGERFQAHTKNIFELTEKYKSKKNIGGSREVQKYLSEAKDAVNSAATDIDSYTEKMSPYILVFKNELKVMLSRFYEFYSFSDQQLQNLEQRKKDIKEFKTFITTMEYTIEQITGFQNSIKNLPSITSKLIKSRKRAAMVLGDFIAEIKIAIDQGKEIITKLEHD